jgi:hypothetical protein
MNLPGYLAPRFWRSVSFERSADERPTRHDNMAPFAEHAADKNKLSHRPFYRWATNDPAI